jgi:TetR/AcrR family transcriptional regulator, transcriptional repressor for nem operon
MSDTRSDIINLAEELVLTKGYNWFSYADISKPLNIKNAAVHYHFPSKEDLGLALVQKQAADFRAVKQVTAASKTGSAESAIKLLAGFYKQYIKEKKVCMIGSMGTDLLTLPESIQKQLKLQLDDIWKWLTEQLEQGKTNGEFRYDTESRIKALDFISNLAAGVQIARIEGTTKEFDALVNMFFAEIKA